MKYRLILLIATAILFTGCNNKFKLVNLKLAKQNKVNTLSKENRMIVNTVEDKVQTTYKKVDISYIPKKISPKLKPKPLPIIKVQVKEKPIHIPTIQTAYKKADFVQTTSIKRLAFNDSMRTVAQSLQADKNYKKIALNTTKNKKWFKVLMYRLWDKQMSREQFINEGIQKYPYNAYEFSFIANGFAKLNKS